MPAGCLGAYRLPGEVTSQTPPAAFHAPGVETDDLAWEAPGCLQLDEAERGLVLCIGRLDQVQPAVF